jgi:WD repeat-containing protein 44
VGLVNGICQVYEYFKGGQDYQVKHIQNINCKNRKGYFAKGTKVTSIVFFSGNELPNIVIVTTNDSRIRCANIKTAEILLKIKGHKNTNSMLRGSMSSDGKHLLCASDDGAVFIWSQIKQRVIELSKKGFFSKVFTSCKLNEAEHFQAPVWP